MQRHHDAGGIAAKVPLLPQEPNPARVCGDTVQHGPGLLPLLLPRARGTVLWSVRRLS